jgi:hypothetical protein
MSAKAPAASAPVPAAAPQVVLTPLKPALIAGLAHTVPVLVRVQAPDADAARLSAQAVGLEYIYQLRKEPSGVELDEWNGPRVATADPVAAEALLLRDTWRSAGTVDYAFETAAFRALLPARGHFSRPAIHANANHLVELRMAAVPERLVRRIRTRATRFAPALAVDRLARPNP